MKRSTNGESNERMARLESEWHSDLCDQAMHAKTFQEERNLARGFVGEQLSQIFVSKTADSELSLSDGAE